MKIVFLSRYQKTINRGAETFVAELSSNLRNKGIVVEVLTGNEADSLKRILAGKYDVVIAVNGGWQAFKSSVGRLLGNYKLLISGQAGIGKGSLWNLAVMPDLYVGLTEYMVKWAKKWGWFNKVVKIPNGVDLNKFTAEGEKFKIGLPRPIILSVGALAWYKHHERTIEAVKKLDKGSLLLVGEGLERKRLEKQGEALGNRFKIIQCDYEEVPRVYRSGDIFVLPSWKREAFGIVYLEAMASGLGVVAPDDEPRREIIGEGGILVDVRDPSRYAYAIKDALKVDWSKKARAQAEKFSWEIIAGEYTKLFSEITK